MSKKLKKYPKAHKIREMFMMRNSGHKSFQRQLLHKKIKFLLKISSVNTTNSAVNYANLVTLTEKILNGKLHFV